MPRLQNRHAFHERKVALPLTKTNPSRSALASMGVAACAGYAAHAIYHVINGTPQDMLWTCHLAALLVGAGLLGRWSIVNAAGLMCLLLGLPMWLLYLFSGEPLIPTSLLTHVLAPILGFIGARAIGFPRHAWILALGFVAGIMAVTRFTTPSEANVNLAFGPMTGLSLWTVGGAAHWLLLLVQWALGLVVLQWILAKVLPRPD